MNLKLLVTMLCFVSVISFGMLELEVFAIDTCDGSGDCNIIGEYQINSSRALKMSISNGMLRDIFIGENSGALNPDTETNKAYGNVFIGRNSGTDMEIGTGNIFIGDLVAEKLKYGLLNTYIGAGAGGRAEYDLNDPNLYSPSFSTIVGSLAGQDNLGAGNTFLGTEAGREVSTGNLNTLIGLNAAAGHNRRSDDKKDNAIKTGNNNIFIGIHTEAARPDITYSIAIGGNARVEDDHQMVIGAGRFYSKCNNDADGESFGPCQEVATCTDVPGPFGITCYLYDNKISESYWGSGVTSVNPLPFSINATGGDGSDVAGADLIIAGGKSTGSSDGGSVRIQTSPTGASGDVPNDPVDRLIVNSEGQVGIGTSDFGFTHNRLRVYSPTCCTYMSIVSDIDEAGIVLVANDTIAIIGNSIENDLFFQVGGGIKQVIRSNGNVGIGTTTPEFPLEMASGAHVTLGGAWVNGSSRDYKENISDLSANKAIETLKGLKPVEFNYKAEKEEKYVGFIAEDVPALVATGDRKGLSPMDIVAVLTSVVQEQQKMMEKQQETISTLSQKVDELANEVKLKGSLAMADPHLN